MTRRAKQFRLSRYFFIVTKAKPLKLVRHFGRLLRGDYGDDIGGIKKAEVLRLLSDAESTIWRALDAVLKEPLSQEHRELIELVAAWLSLPRWRRQTQAQLRPLHKMTLDDRRQAVAKAEATIAFYDMKTRHWMLRRQQLYNH